MLKQDDVITRDPERGWDRSKVKGLLANLITVSDVTYATALEVVAGGRLYNIVVDTEVGVRKDLVNMVIKVFQKYSGTLTRESVCSPA